MAVIEKVKILVVGDSGVGKTSFVHHLAYDRPCVNPTSTIGCSVEVKLHEYKAGTPLERLFFIELWDVGGSRGHGNARPIFYSNVDGILLVHDLTNKKSHANLRRWLVEVLGMGTSSDGDYDPETFADCHTPMLFIGAKLDSHMGGSDTPTVRPGMPVCPSPIADECNADEIYVECGPASRNMAMAGSSNAVKIVRFFDKVIEHKLHGTMGMGGGRDQMSSHPSLVGSVATNLQERKRNIGLQSGIGGKSQHAD